jgi:hypothetical protein
MPDLTTPEERGRARAAQTRRDGMRDLSALIADLEARGGHARLVDLNFARHQLARLTAIEEQETTDA